MASPSKEKRSRSGILGGAVFGHAISATNESRGVSLFEHIRVGAGLGLRVMLNKTFRTNINIDFGVGDNSQGFYFSGTETF